MTMLIPNCRCQDFQTAFKMSCITNCDNVAQKLSEMTDIHQNKIESEKKSKTNIKSVRTYWQINDFL